MFSTRAYHDFGGKTTYTSVQASDVARWLDTIADETKMLLVWQERTYDPKDGPERVSLCRWTNEATILGSYMAGALVLSGNACGYEAIVVGIGEKGEFYDELRGRCIDELGFDEARTLADEWAEEAKGGMPENIFHPGIDASESAVMKRFPPDLSEEEERLWQICGCILVQSEEEFREVHKERLARK